MKYETINLIAIILTAIGFIITLIGSFEAQKYLDGFEVFTKYARISLLVFVIALAISFLIPHSTECTCEECYEQVGTYNGVQVGCKNNNIYYYDTLNDKYIEIVEEDGTPYTYDEYIENSTKEIVDNLK